MPRKKSLGVFSSHSTAFWVSCRVADHPSPFPFSSTMYGWCG